MTKPTILILTIVYLASVLVVGIFGMQIMSFNNINYIASITLDEKNVEFSHDKSLLRLKEHSKDDEATPYKVYNLVILSHKAGMTIKITPTLIAIDPTLDPTNKELDVNVLCDGDDNCISYSNGIFTINRNGGATVTYKSKDNSNKKMVVEFFIL